VAHIKNTLLIFMSLMVLGFTSNSLANDTSEIKDIRVDGLQRVAVSKVFNLLPLDIGDEFDRTASTKTIKELYKTGLFQEVDIFFKNQVVLVKVTENPTIAEVVYKGNKVFNNEVLDGVFKTSKLSQGDIYSPKLSDRLIKEMKQQYLNEGKYAAKVELKSTDLGDSRVALQLLVNEGKTATVKKITVIGNTHFENNEILSKFKTKTKKGLNPFGSKNRYSKAKLTADIENVISMYQDAGFADFAIKSSRVSITPEKDGVYVTLSVEEGARAVG